MNNTNYKTGDLVYVRSGTYQNNNYDGVNITIPHKENALKIVKKVDDSAKIIGAVNCLKKDYGFNTDWIGFLYSMKVNDVNLENKNCLILGAGGVARAILYSLSTSKVKGIKIEGRNNIKVKLFQDWINNLYPKNSNFEIPDLIVNLNTSGRKSAFLKIKISLEITDPADIDTINQMLPRIVDNFQVYLRELRIDDLQGSAGMYRLHEELLRRVNIAVRPAKVKDVLFKEMLVQ